MESSHSSNYEQKETNLERSNELLKTLNSNDHKIFNSIKKLEAGVNDELVEFHKESLKKSIKKIEKQHKYHEERINAILQLKALSSLTIYFIAVVLLALILARVAIYGVFEGLGLNQLFDMPEWYFKLLAVVIFIGMIYGVFVIVVNGIENIRRNYF